MPKPLSPEAEQKKNITINVPKLQIDALDSIANLNNKTIKNGCNSRSQLIRDLITQSINEEKEFEEQLQAFLIKHPAPVSTKKRSSGDDRKFKYSELGFSGNDTVVTVNVQGVDLPNLLQFIGKDCQYPSRSELIRYFVKKFLKRYLKSVKDTEKHETVEDCEVFNNHNAQGLVKIPIEGENGETFKTFKILKVLNSPAIEAKPKLVKSKYRKQVPLGRNFPNDPFKEVLLALKAQVLLAFSEINKLNDLLKQLRENYNESVNKSIELEKENETLILEHAKSDEYYINEIKRLESPQHLQEKVSLLEKENAELKEQGKELIRQLQIAEDDVQDLENESDGFEHKDNYHEIERDDLD